MKRILPILIFLFACLPVFSQEKSEIVKPITKGNYIIGGDLKINYQSLYEKATYSSLPEMNFRTNSFQVDISPEIGYFLADGLVIGLSPTIQYSFSKPKSASYLYPGAKGHTVGLGTNVFIKYYLKNNIFLQLETGYVHDWIVQRNSTFGNYTYNYFSFTPSIGYAFFINSKVSFEPKINYTFNKNDTSDTSNLGTSTKISTNGIFLSMQFTIFL